jgi:hypothetical protein
LKLLAHSPVPRSSLKANREPGSKSQPSPTLYFFESTRRSICQRAESQSKCTTSAQTPNRDDAILCAIGDTQGLCFHRAVHFCFGCLTASGSFPRTAVCGQQNRLSVRSQLLEWLPSTRDNSPYILLRFTLAVVSPDRSASVNCSRIEMIGGSRRAKEKSRENLNPRSTACLEKSLCLGKMARPATCALAKAAERRNTLQKPPSGDVNDFSWSGNIGLCEPGRPR